MSKPIERTAASADTIVPLAGRGARDALRSYTMSQGGSGLPSEPERFPVSDWATVLTWNQDETELVSELQAGSETAFDWLVTHYHGPVYNLILSMLGNMSDAADGTQEVFLKAFRGIRSFRQGSSLKTWLYRIAIREALNHKRWFRRHLQKTVSIDAQPEQGFHRIEIEDENATPFEQLAAHEIQAAVHNALHELPEVFRSAVVLRDLEGLSYEEVAEVLECSLGTVKSRILRGRRALKELLEPLFTNKAVSAPGDEVGATSAHAAPRRLAHRASGMLSAFAPAFADNIDAASFASHFARPNTAGEELP